VAENIGDKDPSFLGQLVLTSAPQFQTTYELTQRKRNNSVCRRIKRENCATGIDSARFQPDLQTARAVRFQTRGIEGTPTHYASVLAEEKTVTLTQPADFIPGRMKRPEPGY
jgi:hypothetical protein